MGWSAGFINALNSNTITPKYVLRFLNTPYFTGDEITIAGGFQTSSKLQISEDGPQINGCSVRPGDWSVSFGSFSVPLVGEVSLLFPAVKKGSLAELYCYFGNISERIAIGQLRNISGFKNRWNLDFVDLLTAMTSRLSGKLGAYTAAPDEQKWFYWTDKEVQTTGNWTTTGSSPFPTDINVDDIRPFLEHQRKRPYPAADENGIIRCVPVGTSDEFFVEYSSVTQLGGNNGKITISGSPTLTSEVYPSQRTVQNMPVGSSVYPAALLHGKPWQIFARLLVSIQGNNSNSFDSFPESWNFGATLSDELIDSGDCDLHFSDYIQRTSAAYKYAFVVTAPWSNGIREFITACSNTGQWPVFRQNAISWRGCQRLYEAQIIAALITDSNIISINKIDCYNPALRSIINETKITYQKTPAAELTVATKHGDELRTLPSEPTKIINNAFTYGHDPYTASSSRSAIALGDTVRMFDWNARDTIKITLTLPLQFAFLCAGDVVEIYSQFIAIFNPEPEKMRGMVTEISYNIGQQKVNCTICIPIYKWNIGG